jgi:hypothetical protein
MRYLRHAMALALCLALFGCKNGDGGGPPGAQGGPPEHGAPGAPVAPDGHQDQGGAPGAPYKIPKTVLLGKVSLDDQNWALLEPLFWVPCPGGTHCVNPVRVFRDSATSAPCEFDHVEPPVGTRIPYGSTISVVGKPCTGGGQSPGDSPPPPDSPDVSAPPSAGPP